MYPLCATWYLWYLKQAYVSLYNFIWNIPQILKTEWLRNRERKNYINRRPYDLPKTINLWTLLIYVYIYAWCGFSASLFLQHGEHPFVSLGVINNPVKFSQKNSRHIFELVEVCGVVYILFCLSRVKVMHILLLIFILCILLNVRCNYLSLYIIW